MYEFLPIRRVQNGILETTDGHYLKLLEVEPINFALRSTMEQRNVIAGFASLLKISPVKMQIKSISTRAEVDAYIQKLRRDAEQEPDPALAAQHEDYIRWVRQLSTRDAVSRSFLVVFQYDPPTNERNISYAEIVSSLETTARNFRSYLAQCGNHVVQHDNEDEFILSVFYRLFHRGSRTPMRSRIEDVLACYLTQEGDAMDEIPPQAFVVPRSLDLRHGRYVVIDGVYHAYLMVPADGYRSEVTPGWTSLIVNAGEGIDFDLFLERLPKDRIVQRIGQQIRLNYSRIKDTNATNTDYDDLSDAIHSGHYLKDGLANNEDFYYAAILITVTAATEKDLLWRVEELRKLLVAQDMAVQLCSFRQEAALLSSLPLCAPDKKLFDKYKRNMLTSTVASCYPFVAFELCDDNGLLLGLNKYNNSLISLDHFDSTQYKNANIAVIGTSGAGKTFTIQLIARRLRLAGVPTFIIAPLKGHEFYRLAQALNGTIIQLAPGSASCINIMEIRPTDRTADALLDGDIQQRSILAGKIQSLHVFFSLLIPDMTNEERQLLDEALIETYAQKGITHDNDSLFDPATPGCYRTMPVLGDVYDLLLARRETRRMANVLNRLVHGSASNFNRQTNVDLDNPYVVLDISNLTGDLLTLGMYTALDLVWDKAKQDRTQRKQIIIDEAWQVLGASSNPLAANYVLEAAKTIRGYGGGVLVATQDIDDFLSLDGGKYGRGILNNCKIKIVLGLEEEEARRVQGILHLTDTEIANITRFERGSALISTNSNNVTIDIRCSELEKELITTDRAELRRIVERRLATQEGEQP